jgi:AraC-like DNA-binding protein
VLDATSALVRTSAVGFSDGYRWLGRRSAWGQLLWASRGAIGATTAYRQWIIPAGHAIWLPPDTVNDVVLGGRGVLRSVFLAPSQAAALRPATRLLCVGDLLRALLRRTFERGVLLAADEMDGHVDALLVGERREALARDDDIPMDLPLPKDRRARLAADWLLANPRARLASLELARRANASRRTLERLFAAETGLSLGHWQQRNALLFGMRRLADGDNVSEAAVASGYASTSAFIAAFRRVAGTTPGRVLGDGNERRSA